MNQCISATKDARNSALKLKLWSRTPSTKQGRRAHKFYLPFVIPVIASPDQETCMSCGRLHSPRYSMQSQPSIAKKHWQEACLSLARHSPKVTHQDSNVSLISKYKLVRRIGTRVLSKYVEPWSKCPASSPRWTQTRLVASRGTQTSACALDDIHNRKLLQPLDPESKAFSVANLFVDSFYTTVRSQIKCDPASGVKFANVCRQSDTTKYLPRLQISFFQLSQKGALQLLIWSIAALYMAFFN